EHPDQLLRENLLIAGGVRMSLEDALAMYRRQKEEILEEIRIQPPTEVTRYKSLFAVLDGQQEDPINGDRVEPQTPPAQAMTWTDVFEQPSQSPAPQALVVDPHPRKPAADEPSLPMHLLAGMPLDLPTLDQSDGVTSSLRTTAEDPMSNVRLS